MKKFLLVIYILFGILFVLFLLETFVFSIYIWSSKTVNNQETTSERWRVYRSITFDPATKESLFSLISSPESIGEYDYISYENRNGKQVLVSNVGEEVFECHGRCTCVDNDRFRRSGQVLNKVSKGVTYLLVAVSSIIAFEKSSKYFEEYCTEQMSDVCDPSSSYVKSEWDNCISHLTPYGEYLGYQKLGYTHNTADLRGKYLCRGRCIKNNDFIDDVLDVEGYGYLEDDPIAKEIEREIKHYDCEHIRLEETYDHVPEAINEGVPSHMEKRDDFMALIWSTAKLNDFCEKESSKKYVGEICGPIEVPFCTSVDPVYREETGKMYHEQNKCMKLPDEMQHDRGEPPLESPPTEGIPGPFDTDEPPEKIGLD